MCFCKSLPLLLLAGSALAAGDGYIIGIGAQGDSTEGLAGTIIGSYGFTEQTWLSAGIAGSQADGGRLPDPKSTYADIEIDHWFKPVGIRIGAAYWGDPDRLDSVDGRASLYWRGDKASISGNYEYRDFTLHLPDTDLFRGRTIDFNAKGLGALARFNLSDNVDLSLSGMTYDYSVNLNPDESRDTVRALPISRLGLISTLVDKRGKVSLGLDHGSQRWQIDLSAWEDAIDGFRTTTASVSFLTAMGDVSDIEFTLGFDDSELYGDVSFFSVYFYFYGEP